MNTKSALIIAVSLLLSIVLAGALIAGAIYLSRPAPLNISSGSENNASSVVNDAAIPKTLTVSATNYEDAVPDFAQLSLNYSCQSEFTANKALERITESIKAAVDALIYNGVLPADIQTTGTSVYYDSYYGYFSSSGGLNVKVRDIDKLGALLDAAYNVSDYQSCWYSFDVLDREAAYEIAVKNAISDAEHKARILADDMGLTLAEIIAVDDSYDYNATPLRYYDMTIGKGDAVMSGTTRIQASVQITYKLS